MRTLCAWMGFWITIISLALTPAMAIAQSGVIAPSEIIAQSGEAGLGQVGFVGAYLSWYKLLALALVYLLWVFLADRVNVPLLRWGPDLQMSPEWWNLITVGGFLAGLAAVLLIPIFWVGLPVYLVGAVLPPVLFRVTMRNRVKSSDAIAFKVNPDKANVAAALPQEEGAEITFFPAGDTEQAQKLALIMARQSPAFVTAKNLIANLLINRADLLLMDFTPQGVGARMQVDGAWHNLPSLDRTEGDAVLTSLKHLAGANPAERRARQRGVFRLKYPVLDLKTGLELISQGVSTGERAQLKILRATGKDMTLAELGVDEANRNRLLAGLNYPGLVVVSAPPREGLTSTWRAALQGMDRFTRDCVAILDEHDMETEVENLVPKRFQDGDDPWPVIRLVLLTQPDMLVVPKLVNSAVLDRLAVEAVDENRTIVTQVQAMSATEALLKIVSMAGDRNRVIQALTVTTCQRLIRRLCSECKVPVEVKPEMIQRLGGDPRQVQVIYRPFSPPPPDQRVDENGKPVEIPVCPQCQGLGYFGRTVIFETLVLNDAIRAALMKKPQLATILNVAQRNGHLDLTAQSYRMVLEGVTSIEEVKRVFQASS